MTEHKVKQHWVCVFSFISYCAWLSDLSSTSPFRFLGSSTAGTEEPAWLGPSSSGGGSDTWKQQQPTDTVMWDTANKPINIHQPAALNLSDALLIIHHESMNSTCSVTRACWTYWAANQINSWIGKMVREFLIQYLDRIISYFHFNLC